MVFLCVTLKGSVIWIIGIVATIRFRVIAALTEERDH